MQSTTEILKATIELLRNAFSARSRPSGSNVTDVLAYSLAIANSIHVRTVTTNRWRVIKDTLFLFIL
jgi:hypothetical protein